MLWTSRQLSQAFYYYIKVVEFEDRLVVMNAFQDLSH